MSTQTLDQKPDLVRPEPFIKPGQMYVAFDRNVCDSLRCAGNTALYAGRTIDGVRLYKVRAADVAEWAEYGDLGPMTCECGAKVATLDEQGKLLITDTTAAVEVKA